MADVLQFPTRVERDARVIEPIFLTRLRELGASEEATAAIIARMRAFLDLVVNQTLIASEIAIPAGLSSTAEMTIRAGIDRIVTELGDQVHAMTNAIILERFSVEIDRYRAEHGGML